MLRVYPTGGLFKLTTITFLVLKLVFTKRNRKMNSSEFKASLVCIVAFVVGCMVALSGCAMGTATRTGVGQHQYETGAGIYIEKQK
tara:strand:+ start:760 stop:1017 length:258 start_codon:yes stop_codon:yes gene_type:complete